jgi:hypothetical protein
MLSCAGNSVGSSVSSAIIVLFILRSCLNFIKKYYLHCEAAFSFLNNEFYEIKNIFSVDASFNKFGRISTESGIEGI